MPKYLYLTRRDWVLPWTLGGVVPIYPASKYLSDSRGGTKTPDENLIHESPVDISSLKSSGFHFENVRNVTMIGCVGVDGPIPDFHNANYYLEDGLILSFCNKKSSEICSRLGKEACVVIHDINALKLVIDSQLGVEGVANDCRYAVDHQRNHFLKSVEDEWQCEYRIFWPLTEEMFVTLPAGIGRTIKMKNKL